MAGFLFPRARSTPPEIAGFRVQTSVYGLPVPVVFGQARIAGNLIHKPYQIAYAQTEKPSKWSGRVQTGWDYQSGIALALCEGTITGIGDVWSDKDEKVPFTDYQANGWGLELGTATPTVWPLLTSNFPAEAVPYQFTAYVYHNGWSLPNNVLPNLSWEVKGLLQFGGGVVDALPTDVLEAVLTNAQYGAGWDAAMIGSLTDAEDYCAAAGLFVSPAFNALRPLAEGITELMDAANCALVWSDAVLKVIPRGDTSLTGHGHTYTPNTTPIYDLTDTDYLTDGDEAPVVVRRKDPLNAYNQVTVEFENRAHEYNLDIAVASNDEAILNTFLRPAPKVSLPMVKDPDVARIIAQLKQQREQFVLNEYTCKVGWKFSLLEPMDLITLTDSGLGLSLTPVRIIQVTEMADARGIELVCEDWPFGTASATLYPVQDSEGFKPSNNIDPGDTSAPNIFEPPVELQTAVCEIWIAAAGASEWWGGCDVYFSTDDVNFSKVGTIHQPAAYGETTDALPTDSPLPAIDTTHTVGIDLTTSRGALENFSNDEFDAYIPLVKIGSEFLLYRDAVLTAAFNYDIDHLGRGAYGSTIPASHASGSSFVMIDGRIFKFAFPEGVPGQTVYFKFPAFNVFENALQDLASATSYSHTIARDPTFAALQVSMELTDTDGIITWSGNDVEVNIDEAGWTTPSASPITVPRNEYGGAIKVYAFRSFVNGQVISDTVQIPPEVLDVSLGFSAGSPFFDAGADTLDVTWTSSGMPTGTTFNVSYTQVGAGGTSDSATNVTSTYQFTGVTGATGSGTVRIDAVFQGQVIATVTKGGVWFT